MTLQKSDAKELQEKEAQYNEVRDVKLDMLRRLKLARASRSQITRTLLTATDMPEVAKAVGENNVKAFKDYLINGKSDKSYRYSTVVEWIETLDIFTALELKALKTDVSTYGALQAKTINELIGYLEWSKNNNKELYPLRHFTYLMGVAFNSGITFIEFLDLINEDRILSKFSDHLVKGYREGGLLNELFETWDAPSWYKGSLADGFIEGNLHEVTDTMVSYMEKTNQ